VIVDRLEHALARRGSCWRLGRLTQRVAPGIGACSSCETSWAFTRAHVTAYEAPVEEAKRTLTCYCLCEACWAELPVAAREVYYRAMYERWLLEASAEPRIEERSRLVVMLQARWPRIQRAVYAGG
jgi:hypothetical protein